MKAISAPVINFIRDFSLTDPEGTVNFNATIEFKLKNSISKIRSEVFIISVTPKNIDSVHLLNPEISSLNFPVMFHTGKEVISYVDDLCLVIIGNDAENGDYVVYIFPEDCINHASPGRLTTEPEPQN